MIFDKKSGNYRWRILAILFFATTINYIDRNVLSFAMLDEDFRRDMLGLASGAVLTDADNSEFKQMMGYVDAAFKAAYAIGFLLVGWFIDKVGTKIGFAFSIFLWSIAAAFHGLVNSIAGLRIARVFLGIGEAGNFPSAVKTVTEWFPRKERSLATGIFNAGANVGIIATAFAVPYLTSEHGWRSAFLVTGALGLILLLLWLFQYKTPDTPDLLSPEELSHIRSDNEYAPTKKVPWKSLWKHKQTWAFASGKFLTDPVWYLYLTWLPDFFNSNEALDTKLDLKSISMPFLIIYLVSDGGSVFFGWVSSYLIKRGYTVSRARKTTMFICAICVVPIFFASMTHSLYVAVALIALAAAAHQGWSTNLYTTVSDMFPPQAVSSVTGIGGMFGAIGGMVIAGLTGIIRTNFGYLPLFIMAASAYLIALLIIHLLVPNMKKVSY